MELMFGLTKCIRKNILGVSFRILTVQTVNYTRLAEVGRLETPKVQGKYDTGQLFLHRVFGYRGVVLFPWLARVYDRDIPNKRDNQEDANFNHVGKEVKGRTHTFYQVLIDSRDCPYIETLRAWQKKNHPWLELSDVHKETTENVRVTVIPFYMGCRESQATSVYWWRYCIRLENLGDLTVQLRERHWRIFSLSGTLETVRGRGVVGQEPVLSNSLPAFQYSSHVSLQAPSGHMGTFRMEREDGYTFDCRIPPFSLESKSEDPNATTGAM
ncbi:polymerase delta-interacting protein 2 [Blattella germanica]|nr:polymerase delta-interacting protein 2 [Blattella germanica]